jgi:hypothetical protein
VKLPLINLDFANLDHNQILIYHHSLLYTLTSQRKFEGNVWNIPRNEVRKVCADEERKIVAICEELANFAIERQFN